MIDRDDIGVGQPGALEWIIEAAIEMLRNGASNLAVSCWLESRLNEERDAPVTATVRNANADRVHAAFDALRDTIRAGSERDRVSVSHSRLTDLSAAIAAAAPTPSRPEKE